MNAISIGKAMHTLDPAPVARVPAAESTTNAPPTTATAAPSPPPIGTREAMSLLEKVHQTPDYLRAHAANQAAQRAVDTLECQRVDVKQECGHAMSQYGIFALCMPLMGSMIALSKSGLTGNAAIVGLAVGFIGVPALSMWLVNQLGKSRAKEKQAALDANLAAAQTQLGTSNAALQQIEANELSRLWNEHLTQPTVPVGTIEQTHDSVKLGNIVVDRNHGAAAQGVS